MLNHFSLVEELEVHVDNPISKLPTYNLGRVNDFTLCYIEDYTLCIVLVIYTDQGKESLYVNILVRWQKM